MDVNFSNRGSGDGPNRGTSTRNEDEEELGNNSGLVEDLDIFQRSGGK